MTSPHRIDIKIREGGVSAVLTCTAPEGAPCRMWCTDGCADSVDTASPEHEGHAMADNGGCLEVDWFNWFGGGDPLDGYAGDPTELRSGPVSMFWGSFGYQWTYAAPTSLEASSLPPAGPTMYDDFDAAQAVALAWTQPGAVPRYHQQMRSTVTAAMPLLARALNRLEEEHQA